MVSITNRKFTFKGFSQLNENEKYEIILEVYNINDYKYYIKMNNLKTMFLLSKERK